MGSSPPRQRRLRHGHGAGRQVGGRRCRRQHGQRQRQGGADRDKTTKAHDINVETYKGVVQLSGFVDTAAEKDEAAKVAAGVSGVKSVNNSISIGGKTSMGTKLDDTVMTGKVKAALMDASNVKSGQINVETKSGVVQLSGFVDSAAMKDKAGTVAAGVSGVKEVQNVLVVRTN